jgi:predicted transcriptional regulator
MKNDETFISIKLPVVDVKEIERLAEAADRSRSAEVRRAIRLHIERERVEEKAAA